MDWFSEQFDKVGRDFNRLFTSAEKTNCVRTGIVSLREGGHTKIPQYVFDNAPKIRVVDGTKNSLQELSDKFHAFKVLQKLLLPQNALRSIPASICLPTITILALDQNQITHLPESVGNLTKLKKLTLASNPLAELPASIGELKALETLDLSNCRLGSSASRDSAGLAGLGR
ncbi:hypothetical protein CYMTET_25795, partial [Cymbomonas tetramitiformis]